MEFTANSGRRKLKKNLATSLCFLEKIYLFLLGIVYTHGKTAFSVIVFVCKNEQSANSPYWVCSSLSCLIVFSLKSSEMNVRFLSFYAFLSDGWRRFFDDMLWLIAASESIGISSSWVACSKSGL